MTTIGYATLQIIPSLDGVSAAVQKQLGVLPDLGKAAGRSLGDGLAAGVDAAAKKVETASGKIAAANKKVEDSSGKVRVAEAQLQALRDRGISDAGKLAAAEEKLAAAQRNQEQAAGAAKTAADALKTAESNLAEASKRAADGQKAAANAAGDSASKSGLMTRAAGATGKAFDTLADKAKSAGKTILSGIGFGAGMNIGGITKSLIDMGDTFANVNKTIAFSTGATGKELEALNTSVRTIGKDSPKALTDIAESMAGVARATQLTGKPLEDITKRMIKLDGLGQSADIGGLTQAMRAFGVPADKMAAQMDDLFKVSRSTGIGMDQLAQTAYKGAPQFKQFGFGIGETAALLGNLQKAGVNGEQVTVGLNKAMINLSKGGGDVKKKLSDAIGGIQGMIKAGNEAGAMESAGKLFGTKSAGQFVAAIKSGKFNLDEMNQSLGGQQKGILDAGGAVTSMAGAWQMFKNNVMVLLEPIVTKIFASMQKGILWFRGEGVNAIRGFGETLKGIWDSAPVQGFVDAVKQVGGFLVEHTTVAKVLAGVIIAALVPAWITARVEAVKSGAAQLAASYKTVAGWVAAGTGATVNAAKIAAGWVAAGAGAAGAAAKTIAYGVAQAAIKAATVAWTGAQWLLNAALNANPIGLIVIGIAALVAGIVLAYKNSETFRNIVAGAWQWIKDAASATVSWFTGTALPFLGKVWDGIKAGWDGLAAAAGVAWDLITLPARVAVTFFTDTLPGALSAVWDLVKAGWNTLVESAQAVWTGVTDKFNGMIGFVTGLPDRVRTAASTLWDGIKDSFKSALNWIIGKWNGLSFKLPSISAFGKTVGGNEFRVPQIPEFFSGGWTGPGGKLDPAGVVHADEFVLSKRARGMLESAAPGGLDFMNKTGRWPGYAEGGKVEGYGLSADANSGGYGGTGVQFPEWVLALGREFNVQPSTYAGHQTGEGSGGAAYGYSANPQGLNRGIDWQGSVADMQRFAERLMAIAPMQTGLEQVIWQNPETGQKAGWAGRRDVTNDSYYDYPQGYPDHRNHVHTRFASAVTTAQPAATSPVAAAAATVDAKTDDKKTTDEKPQTSTPAPSSGGGGSYPTTISGWAGFIGENFVGGQIKSLLSVFGIPDSPSWMKAGSQLLGGIKVADKDGKSLFDGSNPLAGITGAVDGKQQTPTKKTDDSTVGPGAALPLTGQQGTPTATAIETLTSALSAPKAEYKGGSQPIYDAVYKSFRKAGFSDKMWPDFVNLENSEAGWNSEARNPSSDAYGLAQFLGKGNIDKYLGGKNRDVPVDAQADGMMQYIKDRYGDPAAAWAFWQKNNWYADGGRVKPFLYDAGGLLPQGLSLVENRSGGPEPILTKDYWSTAKTAIDVASSMVKGQAGGQGRQMPTVNYTINARDTEDAFIRANRQEKERAAAKLSRF